MTLLLGGRCLQKMLVLHSRQRITTKEALKHAFFDDLEGHDR